MDVFEGEADMIPLEMCPHVFHRECMLGYLKTKIEERKFPFMCPDP